MRLQAAALVDELRRLGSDAGRAGMARFGIDVANASGVSVATLRTLAKRLGTDHELAQALWATGHHEARLLACFIDDPAAVTPAQAQAWGLELDSWDLCDQAATSLFIRTPFAWRQAVEWAQRGEPWVRRAGFAMMAGLAVHDKQAADRAFMELLPLVEQAATDDRDFVRKGVSWALRSIGKRNEALRAAALACARGILAAANERAGGARGGDPGARAARRIATDAIRELQARRRAGGVRRAPETGVPISTPSARNDMRKNPDTPAGTVHRLALDSRVLRGNLLGDPTTRVVDVYVPHGHDGRRLPLLVDVVGFTAGGPAHTNWKNFGENVPERLDRLISSGAMPPVVVAFPDCFTRLGGNQYVNSEAMGRWDDFLLQEAVPLVEERFGCGGAGRRGLFGKSSGGYGAMVHALLHPDFWSAAAVHSGDMGFELLYRHEFVPVLRALAKEPDIGKWVDAFWDARKPKDSDVHILMILAQAATFDPDPGAPYGVRLPVTLDTCELIPERWANWMAWDPLVLVDKHGDGLKALKALYIDCGDVDQYNLVYGARRMHKRLDAMGVPHVYEEFDDDHTAVDYRMDTSLPILARALA